MTAKVTFILTASSQHNSANAESDPEPGVQNKTGSVTENYYSALSAGSAELKSAMGGYIELRSLLMTQAAAIVGGRMQTVGLLGAALPLQSYSRGAVTTEQDIPQMALKVTARSTASLASRSVIFAAIPDARVLRGSYKKENNFHTAFQNLLDYIKTNFLMQAIDQTKPRFDILSIDVNGNVVMDQETPFDIDDNIQVMRTVNAKLKRVGGMYRISTKTDATHFKLADWDLGATVKGKMREHAVNYEAVTFTDYDRDWPAVTIKKFGRPFNSLGGSR